MSEPTVHRWTRAEYDAMVLAGHFDHSRVELLEGEIIDMASASNRHIWAVMQLAATLTRALDPDLYLAGAQVGFALSDVSEPEPDILVFRNGPDLYRYDHAGPSEVVLLIEVSLSSWRYDSGRKLAAYARGGVQEVWIVDLNRGVVHVCRQPVDDLYTERFTVGLDGTLTVPGTDVSLAVNSFVRS